MDLNLLIRDVPDFPKPGIVFKDITPLLGDAAGFKAALNQLAARLEGIEFDALAGIESRGFIFAAPLAERLNLPFVPIRKKGKLPADTLKITYDLEYGTDTIEVHRDAVTPGRRFIIVDDLLATGGTAAAAARLLEDGGGKVAACLFLVELSFLDGRKRLGDMRVESELIY